MQITGMLAIALLVPIERGPISHQDMVMMQIKPMRSLMQKTKTSLKLRFILQVGRNWMTNGGRIMIA